MLIVLVKTGLDGGGCTGLNEQMKTVNIYNVCEKSLDEIAKYIRTSRISTLQIY